MQTQCVVQKSVWKRGCSVSGNQKPVELTDQQWSEKLNYKTVKSSLFSSDRLTDKEIGLNTTGLTKSKTSPYTMPHILTMRLSLMKHLVKLWEESDREQFDLTKELSKLWVNQLVEHDFFIRFVRPDGSVLDEDQQLLVLSSSPFFTLRLRLQHGLGGWMCSKTGDVQSWCVDYALNDYNTIEIVKAEPFVNQGPLLCWKETLKLESSGKST